MIKCINDRNEIRIKKKDLKKWQCESSEAAAAGCENVCGALLQRESISWESAKALPNRMIYLRGAA